MHAASHAHPNGARQRTMRRVSGTPELAYGEGGDPLGSDVVLLHSLGTDSRMWAPQIDGLSVAHRVIIPDSRGHGRSGWSEPLSLAAWVEDLDRLLDCADVRRATLVGLSMGGIQAMAYALAHPHRVSALILADTFAELDAGTAADKIAELCDTARARGMAELATTYLADTLTKPLDYQLVSVLHAAICGLSVDAYVASVRTCFGARLAARLEEITAPALVLWGTRDHKTPRALAEQLRDGIPHAELVEIPDAGHLSSLEQPEGFLAAIKRFIDSVQLPTLGLN